MIESNWWQLYRAAVFEINRSKVLHRVKAAEDAMRARASLGGQVSGDERISIQDAMAALLVLRRELAQSRYSIVWPALGSCRAPSLETKPRTI
jgi:hypothetical protein